MFGINKLKYKVSELERRLDIIREYVNLLNSPQKFKYGDEVEYLQASDVPSIKVGKVVAVRRDFNPHSFFMVDKNNVSEIVTVDTGNGIIKIEAEELTLK